MADGLPEPDAALDICAAQCCPDPPCTLPTPWICTMATNLTEISAPCRDRSDHGEAASVRRRAWGHVRIAGCWTGTGQAVSERPDLQRSQTIP